MPKITVNFFTHESVEIIISDAELKELKEEEELSCEMIDSSDKLIHQKHSTVESWELNPSNPYDINE